MKGGPGRTEVVQQLLGSVLRRPQLEELGVLVDELGVHGARQELLVVEHVLQEGDVGLQDRGGREGVSVTRTGVGDPGYTQTSAPHGLGHCTFSLHALLPPRLPSVALLPPPPDQPEAGVLHSRSGPGGYCLLNKAGGLPLLTLPSPWGLTKGVQKLWTQPIGSIKTQGTGGSCPQLRPQLPPVPFIATSAQPHSAS